MQITLINASVAFDGETVLSQVNFDIREKEKIALVGRNGCGKTTLFNVLTGKVIAEAGTGEEPFAFIKSGKPTIGYLEQVSFDENKTLFEEVITAFSDVLEAEKNMNTALLRLETDSSEQAVKTYSFHAERYEALGGYTYLKECKTAIAKFGFANQTDKPLSFFSGGERTKIALLKTLLSRPDVLLLDEPTNHLDVEAVRWLENYLKAYKKSCVIVSHDRMFLDRIVNVVYEIEYGETTRYNGNYSAFARQKRENYEKALKDASEKAKEIARLQAVVDRFRYKAKKAAMAQAKLSQIRRIGDASAPQGYDTATFHANFQPERPTVTKSLVVDKLSFGYGKPLGEVTFTLTYGDKLGIIGANGCGKSTMVKTIVDKERKLSGNSTFGLHAKIGYFDQKETQTASTMSVFDDFQNQFPNLSNQQVRTALGAFMFSGDDVFKKVCDLSGGERVRLALCKIFKRRPNVLVLDEPTNHMDLVGKENFENILTNFPGTLLLVSHDRYLIDKVCNKLVVFEKDGAKFYECGYEEYESLVVEREKAEQAQGEPKTHKAKREKSLSDEKLQLKKQRELKQAEFEISLIEEKIADINEQMCDPKLSADYLRLGELSEEVKKLETKLAEFLAKWEEISKSLS